MIRIDMSEYMERHTVSRLVGSPPDMWAMMKVAKSLECQESLIRHPPDEMKAHPDVFNILLQILEDKDGCQGQAGD